MSKKKTIFAGWLIYIASYRVALSSTITLVVVVDSKDAVLEHAATEGTLGSADLVLGTVGLVIERQDDSVALVRRHGVGRRNVLAVLSRLQVERVAVHGAVDAVQDPALALVLVALAGDLVAGKLAKHVGQRKTVGLKGQEAALGQLAANALEALLDQLGHVLVDVVLAVGNGRLRGRVVQAVRGADPRAVQAAQGEVTAGAIGLRLGRADVGDAGNGGVRLAKVKSVGQVGHVVAAPLGDGVVVHAVAVGLGPLLNKLLVRGVVDGLREDVAAAGPGRDDLASLAGTRAHGDRGARVVGVVKPLACGSLGSDLGDNVVVPTTLLCSAC